MTHELEKLQRKGTKPICPDCHATVLSTSQPNLMGTTPELQKMYDQFGGEPVAWRWRAPAVGGEMTHTRSCAALGGFDSDCTCCLEERKALATEQVMHAAWRKRAEEAEATLAAPPASPLRGMEALEAKLQEIRADKSVHESYRLGRIEGLRIAIETISASPPEQPAAVKMYRDALTDANVRIAELEDRLSKAAFNGR